MQKDDVDETDLIFDTEVFFESKLLRMYVLDERMSRLNREHIKYNSLSL